MKARGLIFGGLAIVSLGARKGRYATSLQGVLRTREIP